MGVFFVFFLRTTNKEAGEQESEREREFEFYRRQQRACHRSASLPTPQKQEQKTNKRKNPEILSSPNLVYYEILLIFFNFKVLCSIFNPQQLNYKL